MAASEFVTAYCEQYVQKYRHKKWLIWTLKHTKSALNLALYCFIYYKELSPLRLYKIEDLDHKIPFHFSGTCKNNLNRWHSRKFSRPFVTEFEVINDIRPNSFEERKKLNWNKHGKYKFISPYFLHLFSWNYMIKMLKATRVCIPFLIRRF